MSDGFFEKRDGVYLARTRGSLGEVQSSFFVSGDPIAAPRPRMGKHHVYHAANADRWMHSIMLFSSLKIHAPLLGPIEVNLQFLFDKPKKDAHRFWMDHKPDLDNLEKAVLDALTKAKKWKDDSQVVRIQSLKRYTLDDESPGVHIEIVSLPQTPDLEVTTSAFGSGARGFSHNKISGEL